MYACLTLTELLNPIGAYVEGEISLRALRAYFALSEMQAIRLAAERKRRKAKDKKRRGVFYGPDEISRLTGLSRRSVGQSLAELHRAELLVFSTGKISFRKSEHQAAAGLIEEARGRRSERRPIPLPRPLLRYLARARSASLIITAVAYCVRGLTITRQGEIKNTGTVKATWIGRVFGLSERAVRYARSKLLNDGIITADETKSQFKKNRCGAFFSVVFGGGDKREESGRPGDRGQQKAPGGDRPTKLEARQIAPLPPERCASFAPPLKRQENLLRKRNQKTEKSASGVFGKGEGEGVSIKNIRLEDLQSFMNTEELYFQAIDAGWIQHSEASALNFLAAAVRAKTAKDVRDPVRLFVGIVRKGLWRHITQAEEDRARQALQRYREEESGRFRTRKHRPTRFHEEHLSQLTFNNDE